MSARLEAAAKAYVNGLGYRELFDQDRQQVAELIAAADGVMFSAERIALLTIELEHFRTSEEPPRVFAHRIIAALREGA